MKNIHYQIKYKMLCKYCKITDYPYIRAIRFKNSKEYSCSAFCRKCNSFLENIPKTHIIKQKIK